LNVLRERFTKLKYPEPKYEMNSQRIRREILLFLSLFLVGIAVLPAVVFSVGGLIFGDYGTTGFSGFYGTLHSELRSLDIAAWTLVLAPYLSIAFIRFGVRIYRAID